jgi:phosphatidate cytidylyltransferase
VFVWRAQEQVRVSSLLQRVLAAIVLIPVVVAAILWLPTVGFALLLGAFAVTGGHEWCRVGQLPRAWHAVFVVSLTLALTGGYFAMHSLPFVQITLAMSILWWLLAFVAVVARQRDVEFVWFEFAAVRAGAGMLILYPAWVSLVWLHAQQPTMVLFVMVLIWVADSAAYFAGRQFGRRKLASRVSPGKSWEGVAGGLLAVVCLAVGVALASDHSMRMSAVFVALSLVVAVASVLGDLIESLFKRRAGVKDSGTLIPGHGGVLDRIDSLTAAGPCFALGWLLSGGMA